MGFKKFIVGGNGFPTDFSIGGLPIFSDDLKQLETNSQIFGLYGMLKGWSCILSGCLIDELNTTTKTLTMTAGLVLLNDVVYEVPELVNQTYPFSITKGSSVVDTRLFKDGNAKDVAIDYNHNIRTNFTYNDGNGGTQTTPNEALGLIYPTDISLEEVYFDPFTAQKAEYIIKAKNSFERDVHILSQNTLGQVYQTETLKNIVGNVLSVKFNGQFGEAYRWKYYGFIPHSTNGRNLRMNTIGRSQGGDSDNEIMLTNTQVPLHRHSIDPVRFQSVVENAGLPTVPGYEVPQFENLKGTLVQSQPGPLSGSTDFNYPVGTPQDPINIENAYLDLPSVAWFGYAGSIDFYDQGAEYKFWQDGVYYTPNM
jgi:hypothetical protein